VSWIASKSPWRVDQIARAVCLAPSALRFCHVVTCVLNVVYRLRSFARTRLKSLRVATGSFRTVEAGAIGGAVCSGIGSAALSRPCLVNTERRRTISWHSEHMNVSYLKPGAAIVFWTRFNKIISASQALQRIGLLTYQR
jgi:hypothetical protein